MTWFVQIELVCNSEEEVTDHEEAAGFHMQPLNGRGGRNGKLPGATTRKRAAMAGKDSILI